MRGVQTSRCLTCARMQLFALCPRVTGHWKMQDLRNRTW